MIENLTDQEILAALGTATVPNRSRIVVVTDTTPLWFCGRGDVVDEATHALMIDRPDWPQEPFTIGDLKAGRQPVVTYETDTFLQVTRLYASHDGYVVVYIKEAELIDGEWESDAYSIGPGVDDELMTVQQWLNDARCEDGPWYFYRPTDTQ